MRDNKFPWFVLVCVVCFMFGLTAIGVSALAKSQRRGEKLEPPITVAELPGDFTGISWAVELVPADPVALASPERVEVAGNILASMLSDPLFRAEVTELFFFYKKIGHKDDEASAMAKGWAAQVAYAFADALALAAAE